MKQLKTAFPFLAFADSRQGGRRENQDSCAWGDTPAGFLVTVCDGMGGGPSGKEASVTAAQEILHYVQENGCQEKDRIKLMRQAINAANRQILAAVVADPSKKGMGTTVTALLINEYAAVVAHVGDSRVYQFRQGRKHFRTDDHSFVFEKIREGEIKSEEEARTHPDSNIILRALGISETVCPEIVELAYERGDRFMLCSDGIWGMFPEKTIVSIAAKTAVLSGAVESMVVRVDEEGIATGGGHDNLTMALIETMINSKMKEKMSTRQKNVFLIVCALCLLSIALNVFFIFGRLKENNADANKQKIEDLVMVVSGLKEDLEETQARLEQESKNHVQFVERLVMAQQSQDTIAVRAITDSETKDVMFRRELNDIMADIKRLSDMNKGREKDELLKSVIDRFEQFADKTGTKVVSEKKREEVLRLLGNDVAKQDDTKDPKKKVKGHYNSINKRLMDIFEKI